jgi:hypothetical protein
MESLCHTATHFGTNIFVCIHFLKDVNDEALEIIDCMRFPAVHLVHKDSPRVKVHGH